MEELKDQKKKMCRPGSSDRRVHMEEEEGEAESVLVIFF